MEMQKVVLRRKCQSFCWLYVYFREPKHPKCASGHFSVNDAQNSLLLSWKKTSG